jgi:uncharacterized protein
MIVSFPRITRQTLAALLLACCAMLMASAWAQQPVPALGARVIDQTSTLSASQKQTLETKLADLEAKKGTQIVVLMVPTTQPEDIAAYANRVGSTWKIGRRDVGDGLLLVVAKNDHRMRIEVARALEGAVPDIAAAQIIDEVMKPRFRDGDFFGGIDGALDQLIARISGEPLPAVQPVRRSSSTNGNGDGLIFLLFFGALLAGYGLRAMLGDTLGSIAAGAGAGIVTFLVTTSTLLAVVIAIFALFYRGRSRWWGGGWGSNGGFGGGSGGGFSSGGGGSFGGGGSSGSW